MKKKQALEETPAKHPHGGMKEILTGLGFSTMTHAGSALIRPA